MKRLKFLFCYVFESLELPRKAGLKRRKMKVRASIKKICKDCKIIKRKGVIRVICD